MIIRCLITLFLTCCYISLTGQVDDGKARRLVELLYSTQDLNQRAQGAVWNNADATALETDALFKKELNIALWEDGMSVYSQSAYGIVAELTASEVDSLIWVLESPYGPIVRKAFLLDNSIVEFHLTHHVNKAIHRAKRAVYSRDSSLYFQELKVDVSDYMDGVYTISSPGLPDSRVERKGNKQMETIGEEKVSFDVVWINNSKYAIRDAAFEMDYEAGNHFVYNVYEVDGNVFKCITLLPGGGSARLELIRDEPIPGPIDAQLFQNRLNNQYASPENSPLSTELRAELSEKGGHPFFPVNDKYRITADFKTYENPETVILPTSAGTEKEFKVYGKATFPIDGKQINLLIYQNQSLVEDPEYANHLFLPFRDATSGKETYGGGKYIDLRIPAEGSAQILLDFNKSYQPYCAYTDGYFCPVPPQENTIDVRIEAGVMHVDLGEH